MKAAGAEVNSEDNAQVVKDFFEKLDVDGDGKITEEEFIRGAENIPSLPF